MQPASWIIDYSLNGVHKTAPAMGRNPSGTSALAYFRFHQKYWCSGMPFSFNRALIAVPFSRGLALDLLDLFACKHVSLY